MSIKKPFITGVLLVGLFCFVFLISFGVMSLFIKPQTVEAPVEAPSNAVAVVSTPDVIGTHTIVKEQIYYSKCRHLETSELKDDNDFVGKTYADLEALGWQVYQADKGTVVVSKDVDGFCPDDDQKRHISKSGDHIGIYRGPVNLGGELIEELPISVTDLPQDWQTQILNGGYEFASEEALQDALESFDELLYNEDEGDSASQNLNQDDSNSLTPDSTQASTPDLTQDTTQDSSQALRRDSNWR